MKVKVCEGTGIDFSGCMKKPARESNRQMVSAPLAAQSS